MLTRAVAIVFLTMGAALACAQAQPATKIPHIGFVAPQGSSLPLFDGFRQGLAELGDVDGQNVIIEPRFAEGHYDRFPEIFAELLRNR
jgi:putative ABC transport system substrate-binding protein